MAIGLKELAVTFAYDSVGCWIQVSQEADLRVVRIAGRLTSAQVPDLLAACREVTWAEFASICRTCSRPIRSPSMPRQLGDQRAELQSDNLTGTEPSFP